MTAVPPVDLRTPCRVLRSGKWDAAQATAAQFGLELRHDGLLSNAPPGIALACDPATLSAWPGAIEVEDLLLTSPLIGAADLNAAERFDGRLTVTVDHFMHIETLLTRTWQTPPRVVVELALGPARFGGRPGRDAADLANVIADGPLTFAGVSSTVASRGMAEQFHRAVEALQRSGHASEFRSVAAEPEHYEGLTGMTEVRGSVSASSPLAVRVLSRPSLETAVVDAGTAAGLRLKQTLSVSRWSGRAMGTAKTRAVEGSRSLLTLNDAATDLLIGDVVLLQSDDDAALGEFVPRTFVTGES